MGIVWALAVLLFSPFLTYLVGILLTLVNPETISWRALQFSFLSSLVILFVLVFHFSSNISKLVEELFPGNIPILLVLIFGFLVVLPRFFDLSSSCAIGLYDDIWHYQKTVSVFGSFPDLKHYYFPEFMFSYYFYSYIIPAFFYTMIPGVSLKVVWLVYIYFTTVAVFLVIIFCLKKFLPEPRNKWLVVFVLILAFFGGLHEWPEFISSLLAGKKSLHTEWWSTKIGLNLQISSFYTISHWAIQHLLGLGLFSIILYSIYQVENKRKWYFCGALIGIIAGFSIYISFFACFYVGILLIIMAVKNPRDSLYCSLKMAIGGLVTFLPVFKYFLNRESNLLITDNWAVHRYMFFLLVEFGAVGVLFGIYAYQILVKKQRVKLFEKVNVIFILVCLIILFFVQSKGFNVIFFRGMIPAQLLISFSAVLLLSQMKFEKNWAKYFVYGILLIQLTGFFPEMLAMCNQRRRVSVHWPKIPDFVQEINRNTPFDMVLDISYEKNVRGIAFDTMVHSIFRMKNVSKRYFQDGTLDPNIEVYLDKPDKISLGERKNSAE